MIREHLHDIALKVDRLPLRERSARSHKKTVACLSWPNLQAPLLSNIWMAFNHLHFNFIFLQRTELPRDRPFCEVRPYDFAREFYQTGEREYE